LIQTYFKQTSKRHASFSISQSGLLSITRGHVVINYVVSNVFQLHFYYIWYYTWYYCS